MAERALDGDREAEAAAWRAPGDQAEGVDGELFCRNGG